MESNREHLLELLKGFSNAMLVTSTSGELHARPMRVADVDPSLDMWFVTNEESGKIHEIQADSTVLITMQNSSQFVSSVGTATVVRDQVKLDEVWNDAWKLWFPQGKSDPSIVLIRVEPHRSEFWDVGGIRKLQYLYEAGKALLSGKKLDTGDLNVHGIVG